MTVLDLLPNMRTRLGVRQIVAGCKSALVVMTDAIGS
jgi:hypothetical protein